MKLKATLYLFLLALAVTACIRQPTEQEAAGSGVAVTVYGAAGEVSGSLTHLRYFDKQYLVDCGAYYPGDDQGIDYESRAAEATQKNDELPVNAKDIDALFVTHAHIDHTGRIPLLVQEGFRSRIYCTPGTKLLIEQMLESQIRYSNARREWVYSKNSLNSGKSGTYVTAHWNNCTWQQKIHEGNKHKFSGRRAIYEENEGIRFRACRTCTKQELENIMDLVYEVAPGQIFQVEEGLEVKFLPTEHIPGAASVLVTIDNGVKKSRLLFSGDVGNHAKLLQNTPLPFPKADYLWIESTYGDHVRETNTSQEVRRFQQEVAAVVNRGGIAWIPAFALDRTQKVLHLLNEAMESGMIPAEVPIYAPSPLARQVSDIYQEEFETGRFHWFNEQVMSSPALFPDYRKYLPDKLKYPSILVTTSGMMDNAYSLSLLPELINDTRATVFLVGYQDPGTPGGQLKAGRKQIIWQENTYDVKADVRSFGFFSAHADAADMTRLLANQSKDSVQIFLVHGSGKSLEDLQAYLSNAGFRKVEIAEKANQLKLK